MIKELAINGIKESRKQDNETQTNLKQKPFSKKLMYFFFKFRVIYKSKIGSLHPLLCL